ncbi:hypothetical protein PAPYR_11944 [Paratrimastix pyriformis]|uniref:Uncharacterized protein n=1 Tax=Paratrimastix pyriformis TaxID=342808 RepID=A0ABQ8U4F8_9EUKA|nr:hypothetical protein PAPYR_11944 [Paratrimastix pyriformis]
MKSFTEGLDKKLAAVTKTILGAIRPLEAVYGLCSASVADKRSYLDLIECRNTIFLTLNARQEASKALAGVRRSLWRPLLSPSAPSDLPADCIIAKDEAVALREQAVKKAETKRANPGSHRSMQGSQRLLRHKTLCKVQSPHLRSKTSTRPKLSGQTQCWNPEKELIG